MKSTRFVKTIKKQIWPVSALLSSLCLGGSIVATTHVACADPSPSSTVEASKKEEKKSEEQKKTEKNPSAVVETQVSATKDEKDLKITDPAESTLAESIKELTPEWVHPFFKEHNVQFSRPPESGGVLNAITPLDAAEKAKLISLLKNRIPNIKTAEVDIGLLAVSEKKTFSLDARIKRIYFSKNDGPLAQAFREKIVVTAPATLAPYSWLSFRFYTEPFDRAWIYSPQTKKTRPISPLLRSESLFHSAFAADDIFGFSENTIQLEPTVSEAAIRLVPIANATGAPTELVGPCETLTGPEIEKKEVPALVIPPTSLVPKETVSIAFVNKDPFGNYGKITVIVDRETGTPIFKLVESREGKTLRTVVNTGSWTWAKDREDHQALVTYKKSVLCKENQYQWDAADFDPSRLGSAKATAN